MLQGLSIDEAKYGASNEGGAEPLALKRQQSALPVIKEAPRVEIVPGVEVPVLAQSRAPRGLLYLSHVAIQLYPIVLTSMSAVPPTTPLVRPGAPTEWSCQTLMHLTVALGHGREGIAADV